MKKTFHIVLLLLAATCLLVESSLALTITQSLSSPNLGGSGASPPVNANLAFQQFNTILANGNVGILNSVDISVNGQVRADFSIKNTSAVQVNINSNISGDLLLSLEGVDVITLSSGSWVSTTKNKLASGATWTTNNSLSQIASDSTTLTGSTDLALFTGTGLVDLLVYTNLMVSTGISGGTDYINSSQAWAKENVTITYNYTDGGPPAAPEPGTILLLGSGILAFGARSMARLRRRC
ncbi:MAG: PEP-CTERM sorting domain-containing protein [Geobacteraceae bacterium]|nr:PEP-CTERM sorting domain-containing protein [Geobacteraceae bacterium]